MSGGAQTRRPASKAKAPTARGAATNASRGRSSANGSRAATDKGRQESTGYQARLYDAEREDRDVTLTRQLVRSLDEHKILWVDIPVRDPEKLARVASLLDLADESVEALTRQGGEAQVVAGENFIHLTVQAVEEGEKGLVTRDVHVVARPNLVLSIHDGPIDAIERFSEQVGENTRLGRLNAGSFLAALLDSVLSTWFARIEEIEREIDQLDDKALRGPQDDSFLGEVLRLRRRIAFVRRTIAPHREAFAPLARPDYQVDEELGQPWPGLVERLERVIEAAENARELLVGSFDIYLGRAAQRTNEVMKVLTIVSAVLLPSVVLAGIMGMNFKLPFFDDTANFWLVIGGMIALAVTILLVARLRRWI